MKDVNGITKYDTNKGEKSPIRLYQEDKCLLCEEKGKCEYDIMLLCVAIGIYNYSKEVYGLKNLQMKDILGE